MKPTRITASVNRAGRSVVARATTGLSGRDDPAAHIHAAVTMTTAIVKARAIFIAVAAMRPRSAPVATRMAEPPLATLPGVLRDQGTGKGTDECADHRAEERERYAHEGTDDAAEKCSPAGTSGAAVPGREPRCQRPLEHFGQYREPERDAQGEPTDPAAGATHVERNAAAIISHVPGRPTGTSRSDRTTAAMKRMAAMGTGEAVPGPLRVAPRREIQDVRFMSRVQRG